MKLTPAQISTAKRNAAKCTRCQAPDPLVVPETLAMVYRHDGDNDKIVHFVSATCGKCFHVDLYTPAIAMH